MATRRRTSRRTKSESTHARGTKEMADPVSSALQCQLSLLSLVPHLQGLHGRGCLRALWREMKEMEPPDNIHFFCYPLCTVLNAARGAFCQRSLLFLWRTCAWFPRKQAERLGSDTVLERESLSFLQFCSLVLIQPWVVPSGHPAPSGPRRSGCSTAGSRSRRGSSARSLAYRRASWSSPGEAARAGAFSL